MSKPSFWIILFGALILRTYHLAAESYWIDELVSIHFATHEMWKALLWDNHPPTYPFLLKLWIHLFNDSELATRSLSVLFSMMTVFLMGRTTKVEKTFPWAMLLQALNPLSILMAQEARPYALFELATTVHLFSLHGSFQIENLRSKNFISYLISSIFLCGVHYLGFLLVAMEWLFLLRKHWQRKTPFWVVLTLFAMGLSLVLALHFTWSSLEWQTLKFASGESFWELTRSLGLLTSWGLLIVFLVITSRGLHSLFQQSLLKLCFLYFMSLVGLSLLLQRDLFSARYFIILVPLLNFTSAERATSLASLGTRKVLTVLSGVAALTTVFQVYIPSKAPWREAARFINERHPEKIFTTRTLALESPYFKNKGPHLEKLDLTHSPVEQLQETLRKTGRTFILENYWGSVTYLSPLKQDLEKSGYTVKEWIFQKEKSDIVLVVEVSIAPENPPEIKRDRPESQE